MAQRFRRHAPMMVVALAVSAAVACGDGDDGGTPTQPTPPAASLKLDFTFNFLCPSTGFLCTSYGFGPLPTIDIAVMAKTPPGCSLNEVSGTLIWDQAIARNTTQTIGDFMRQGNITPTIQVSRTGNTLAFTVTRPSLSADVSGEGIVLILPFTIAPTASQGETTALRFTSASGIEKDGDPCINGGREQALRVVA